VSLPENERRVLAAISARLDADEAATLPLTVDDLSEEGVVAAAVRLDRYDPPVWDSVSTEEALHPVRVMSLTERGRRESGARPGDEPTAPAQSARSTNGPFMAKVIRVFIASPSDVPEERNRITEVIHRWNADNAETTSTVLLPVRWETHATSEAGGHPQAIVNRQIVDSSDMLIGVFWTRLGTATPSSVSGTAEEIERMLSAGKPVSLFFSNRPVQLDSVDAAQWDTLKAFRASTRDTALSFDFADLVELERMVSSALVRVVRERFDVAAGDGAARVPTAPHAAVRARTEEHYNSRGSQDWRLVLDNTGLGTAEQVTIELLPTGDATSAWQAHNADEPLDFLASGSSARLPLQLHFGSPPRSNCVIQWSNEDGSKGFQQQTLTL